MEIVHIAAECYPVAKVGGLGDVVGALPKYQNRAGNQLRVVIPCYETRFIKENQFENVFTSSVQLGHFDFPFSVLKEKTNVLEYELYLVAIPDLFDRAEVYGYEDDIERFVSFQIATLDWISSKDAVPDLIHCHDHHAGLIPFMMLYAYKYEKLRNIKTVITIHNSIYQGQMNFDKLYYLPEFNLSKVSVLEWDNKINSLAAAIKCASAVNTVSPNYMNEIFYWAHGLESLFQRERDKCKGILNGIDAKEWNPSTDMMLENHFSAGNFAKGKKANKEQLCRQFGLDTTKPLFSFIGRLFEEKGADLLPMAITMALSENEGEINILLLGSGNEAIEKQLCHLSTSFKGCFNVHIGYNEALAHQMYAASDFILMPSRVEPCGLNQLYAMRYGAIPIVRRTGGLKDTVIDFGDGGNGICHDQASVADICYSINRAVALYKDKKGLNKMIQAGMEIDHSWERVSKEYIEMYQTIN